MRAILDQPLFLAYLAVINVAAFFIYGAIHNKWRIPEKVLLLLVVFGGGMGAFGGMKRFRHKTQHIKFRFGVPLIMLLQVAGLIYLK